MRPESSLTRHLTNRAHENLQEQKNVLNVDTRGLVGDFVLTFDERFHFAADNIRLLLDKAVDERPRLITFHALDTRRIDIVGAAASTAVFDVVAASSGSQRSAIGLLHTAAFSRRLLADYAHSSTVSRALRLIGSDGTQCSVLVFNIFLADRLLTPPSLLASKNGSSLALPTPIIQALQHYKTCINKANLFITKNCSNKIAACFQIIRAGYEINEPPFLFSHLTYSN